MIRATALPPLGKRTLALMWAERDDPHMRRMLRATLGDARLWLRIFGASSPPPAMKKDQ